MGTFWNQFFTILCDGSIATAVFVILLLNNKGVRRNRANVFLSVLLVALAFSIFHSLYFGRIISHFSSGSYSPGDPTFLLIAPLSWFYAVALTGQRVRFSPALLLHFVPFLLIVFLSLTYNGRQPGLVAFINDHKRSLYVFFWLMVVAQFLGYQIAMHRKWQAHQQLLRQEVSNTEDVSIAWVKFFLMVFLLINVFFLLSLLFSAIHWKQRQLVPRATAVVFALSVYALSFKGILQRHVFDLIIPERAEEPMEPVAVVASTPVAPDQALLDKLVSFMARQKPYLDPELSLNALAQQVNISRSQLSQLINDGLGENFYDFINKYRVEEVKRLMADPEMAHYNLLGIAFEAGFKSKSTFNLIFKRFTGLTPTEYRKNLSA